MIVRACHGRGHYPPPKEQQYGMEPSLASSVQHLRGLDFIELSSQNKSVLRNIWSWNAASYAASGRQVHHGRLAEFCKLE
jgi:hypothetical protein